MFPIVPIAKAGKTYDQYLKGHWLIVKSQVEITTVRSSPLTGICKGEEECGDDVERKTTQDSPLWIHVFYQFRGYARNKYGEGTRGEHVHRSDDCTPVILGFEEGHERVEDCMKL
jgi:hypothetical protein